jgi:DNA uptake protein ComE-like DNA-binding protein
VIRIVYPSFIKPDELHIENLTLVENEMNEKQNLNDPYKKNNSTIAEPFVFDPNMASLEDLKKLGFREKTAQTLIKFRTNGFKFKQKEDLKKVYGVSEKLFAQLESYILIKPTKNLPTEEKNTLIKKSSSPSKKLELNASDSLALIELKGIGPGYAKRILKYRSLLGGFTSINQIKEIYGMTNELYALIESQCIVNSALVPKININTIEFKALNKHPYINYELTKQIFNFRKQTKITESNLMEVIQDEELTQKLKPYLQY